MHFPAMLKLSDAAKALGISIGTLRSYIAGGEIAVIDVGLGPYRRHLRIDQRELHDFQARRIFRFTNTKTDGPTPTSSRSPVIRSLFAVRRAKRLSERQNKPRRR